MTLKAENLTLAYDKRVVAEGLDVEIPDRGFTAIVGPNACGKSTLLRALARMLKPKRGAVLLDGHEITKQPSKEVARRLGLLVLARPLAQEALMRVAAAGHEVDHADAVRRDRALREQAEPPRDLLRRLLGDLVAVEQDRTGARLEHARERAQQRRLAARVGADDHGDLPGRARRLTS